MKKEPLFVYLIFSIAGMFVFVNLVNNLAPTIHTLSLIEGATAIVACAILFSISSSLFIYSVATLIIRRYDDDDDDIPEDTEREHNDLINSQYDP